MKLATRLILLAAAVALALLGWRALFPAPEKVITRRLAQLAERASFSPGEGNFKRLADLHRLESFFTENVRVTLSLTGGESRVFEGRQELMDSATAARAFANGVNAKLNDVGVQVDPVRNSASAQATAGIRLGADGDLIAVPLQFTFVKTNGDWLISRVESVRTLR